MGKDKIVLTDSTEITLAESQGMGALLVTAENVDMACQLWKRFTPENLQNVTVKNADGLTTGIYRDMILDHVTGENNSDGTVRFTISLRNKSMEEILLEMIDALEDGQQVQDMGIDDLGQAVSDIMAKGGAD